MLYLRHKLGCTQTAEDLTQETYLRVLRQGAIEQIDNLPAYLFRVASHLAIDHHRQTIRSVHGYPEPLDETLVCSRPLPDNVLEQRQALAQMQQAIDELPPQCRRIFLLHKVKHCSYSEIAAELNISPRTVEKQISKALKFFRDRLQTL